MTQGAIARPSSRACPSSDAEKRKALVKVPKRIEHVAGACGRESADSNKLDVCVGNGSDALSPPAVGSAPRAEAAFGRMTADHVFLV